MRHGSLPRVLLTALALAGCSASSDQPRDGRPAVEAANGSPDGSPGPGRDQRSTAEPARASDRAPVGPDGATAACAFGSGGAHLPANVSVTGGGSMPSTTANVLTAACAGDGSTDDTKCLQAAADSAHAQGKTLLIPHTAAFYKISSVITVQGSVIGVGGLPQIRQVATCSTAACGGLKLANDMTGWIYNLNIRGAYTGSNASSEYAHNISVGGVNGVTVKCNLLENAMGDGISDGAQYGPPPARNVLITNNTIKGSYRTAFALTAVSDRWAVLNNELDWSSGYVSVIDLEPWCGGTSCADWCAPSCPDSSLTNVEIAYNKVQTTQKAGYGTTAMQVTAWFDPSPGGGIWVNHNYGSWPDTGGFVSTTGYKGSGNPWSPPPVYSTNITGTPSWAP